MKVLGIHCGVGDIFRMNFFVILLVLFIFNIIPTFGPPKIGTREYLSIIGVIYVVFRARRMPTLFKTLLIANWTQIAFSLLAMVINQTYDIWFIQFAVRNILYLNGAILVVHFFPQKWDINLFFVLLIFAILFNSIVATVAFLNSTVMQLVVGMQQLDTVLTERTIKFGVRMIGLGSGNYFVGGVINGMGIITAFHLISIRKLSPIIGVVLIFLLFIIGLFIARTVIIGFAIGFLLFIRKSKFRGVLSAVIVGILSVYLLFSSGVLSEINTSHAFEIFIQEEGGLLHNRSMNSLEDMYDVKMTKSTWLFGDGLSKEADGSYYMHTDVGYLRCILYFGLLGTIFGYFYYELVVLKSLRKLSPDFNFFAVCMGLFLLVLNFKGLPDFNFYIFLIIAFFMERRKIVMTNLK